MLKTLGLIHSIFNNYISHCNHSDHLIDKKSLTIPKGYAESVNRRRRDNIMANMKGQKDKQRSTKHKKFENVNVIELYVCCLNDNIFCLVYKVCSIYIYYSYIMRMYVAMSLNSTFPRRPL